MKKINCLMRLAAFSVTLFACGNSSSSNIAVSSSSIQESSVISSIMSETSSSEQSSSEISSSSSSVVIPDPILNKDLLKDYSNSFKAATTIYSESETHSIEFVICDQGTFFSDLDGGICFVDDKAYEYQADENGKYLYSDGNQGVASTESELSREDWINKYNIYSAVLLTSFTYVEYEEEVYSFYSSSDEVSDKALEVMCAIAGLSLSTVIAYDNPRVVIHSNDDELFETCIVYGENIVLSSTVFSDGNTATLPHEIEKYQNPFTESGEAGDDSEATEPFTPEENVGE